MIARSIRSSCFGSGRTDSHNVCVADLNCANPARCGRFLVAVLMAIGLWMPTSTLAASPMTVARGKKADAPKQPQVAVAPDNTVHLVYGLGDDVYHAISKDQGKSFSKPQKAFTCPNMSLGMRRGPRIVSSPAGPVVTAIGGPQGKGRDGDILAWRNSEGGEWKKLGRVNDVEGSAREGLHNMTSGAEGALWCCWLDLRDKKTELYVAKSSDGGESWDANRLAYRSPDGSVCECCHPSIAAGAKGSIHLLFRNQLGGKRDMYVVTSEDGERFGDARPLSQMPWMLNACPMDGGMIAVATDQTVWSAYRQKGQLYLSDGRNEAALGRGEQPTIACLKNQPLVLWTKGRVGELMLRAGDAKPRRLSSDARDPVIASDVSGVFAVAAWEAISDEGTAIRVLPVP